MGLKYRNIKSGGYDSKKERNRAFELRMLEKNGEISNLKEQVKFELVPAQWETVNKKKRCAERAVNYIADFQYIKGGVLVVEDTKGFRTADYKIKRKLMLYMHGIKIKEV